MLRIILYICSSLYDLYCQARTSHARHLRRRSTKEFPISSTEHASEMALVGQTTTKPFSAPSTERGESDTALSCSPPFPLQLQFLRAAATFPGQAEALLGGDAAGEQLRRGAGVLVGRFLSVCSWGRVVGLSGLPCNIRRWWEDGGRLRRSEWTASSPKSGISAIKTGSTAFFLVWWVAAVLIFPAGHGGEGEEGCCVPPIVVLLLPACRGGVGEWSGGTVCPALSKRWFLWFCNGVQQQSFPLIGHGGSERGGRLLATCNDGGRKGEDEEEVTHADGFSAVAIYCRLGGRISTSTKEVWSRSGHGSLRPIHHEVMRSPWRVGGPWL
jgi:hypothetical protein